MFNVLYQVQKSASMQSSATVGRTEQPILWITGHVLHGSKKLGVRAHLHPHAHCQKMGGQYPRTPTGSPPLVVGYVAITLLS